MTFRGDVATVPLVIELQFHALARRPDVRRVGRRWDIVVVIDGVEHVFREGPRHRLEVAPGPRVVEVFFRAAGLAFLGRALLGKAGYQRILVEAPPSGEVKLHYHGGMFWHIAGGTLTRVG